MEPEGRGSQGVVSFLEEGMAELRPQRIYSETVEHSDLESDSLGLYPFSNSHQFFVTLGWLGNLSYLCFFFFFLIYATGMTAATED